MTQLRQTLAKFEIVADRVIKILKEVDGNGTVVSINVFGYDIPLKIKIEAGKK